MRLLLAVALSVVMLNMRAEAGFQTQTFTQTVSDKLTNFSYDFKLSGFTADGTLNSVQIYLSDNLTSGGTVKNTARAPEVFSFTENASFSLAEAGQNILNNTFSISGQSTAVLPGSTYTFTPTTYFGSAGPFVQTSNLDMYLAQDIDFNFSAKANLKFVGMGGNDELNWQTYAGETVTLIYTYTPSVPEPSSVLMLASGLVVGWWRLRR